MNKNNVSISKRAAALHGIVSMLYTQMPNELHTSFGITTLPPFVIMYVLLFPFFTKRVCILHVS